MNVLIKRNGESPVFEDVPNTLEGLQDVVGGFIEVVKLPVRSGEIGMVLICDEEARLKDVPVNCELFGDTYLGPFIICGEYGEEFCGIPYDLKMCKLIFSELWEV